MAARQGRRRPPCRRHRRGRRRGAAGAAVSGGGRGADRQARGVGDRVRRERPAGAAGHDDRGHRPGADRELRGLGRGAGGQSDVPGAGRDGRVLGDGAVGEVGRQPGAADREGLQRGGRPGTLDDPDPAGAGGGRGQVVGDEVAADLPGAGVEEEQRLRGAGRDLQPGRQRGGRGRVTPDRAHGHRVPTRDEPQVAGDVAVGGVPGDGLLGGGCTVRAGDRRDDGAGPRRQVTEPQLPDRLRRACDRRERQSRRHREQDRPHEDGALHRPGPHVHPALPRPVSGSVTGSAASPDATIFGGARLPTIGGRRRPS